MQSKRILLCIPYAWTEWEAAAAMLDSEPKPSHAANNLHLFAEITTSVMYWQSDAFRIGSQNFQPRLELACSLQFIVILILNESLPRLLGKIFFTFRNFEWRTSWYGERQADDRTSFVKEANRRTTLTRNHEANDPRHLDVLAFILYN
ncbi:uncharacterized protein [Triticum aestivum]|uniref:uncharacterized protein isoform X3 n=2 Tax=Triticum aestivum TaxID=4565 RepID=UPI001D0342DB|nr:uncharacterized protein LOC123152088 isoform X3 [Triticum aestivum]XP_044427635.1 uncharacterized protein LOC123152088 isoform X3 [Triticum aestivum]